MIDIQKVASSTAAESPAHQSTGGVSPTDNPLSRKPGTLLGVCDTIALLHQRHHHAYRQPEGSLQRRRQFRHGLLSQQTLILGIQPRAFRPAVQTVRNNQ